jgi:hypothetical protein
MYRSTGDAMNEWFQQTHWTRVFARNDVTYEATILHCERLGISWWWKIEMLYTGLVVADGTATSFADAKRQCLVADVFRIRKTGK